MSITATRYCDCCRNHGPVRHSGVRWLCSRCWIALVDRPDGTEAA